MWQRLLPTGILLLTVSTLFAADQKVVDRWMAKPGNVQTAIEYIRHAPGQSSVGQWGMGHRSLAPVVKKLNGLSAHTRYKYKPEDDVAWRRVLGAERQTPVTRLCAAYFLFENDQAARDYIKQMTQSGDVKVRANAATVLLRGARSSQKPDVKTWATDLMLELIASGKLDKGVELQFDNPLESMIYQFRQSKDKRAAPVMIGLIERRVYVTDAVQALEEIGDPKSGEVFLELFQTGEMQSNSHILVSAIGKLKYRPAVPVILKKLAEDADLRARNPGKKDYEISETLLDWYAAGRALEALQEIGDPAASDGIESLLKKELPIEIRRVARRVLVQMKEEDQVAGLLQLLEHEPNEHEQSDLIEALSRHKDERVVKQVAAAARTSKYALVRRDAIDGLRHVGTRSALLELAALIDEKFPDKLEGSVNKGLAGTPAYFQERVVNSLQSTTKQNFKSDRTAWEKWIRANVKA